MRISLTCCRVAAVSTAWLFLASFASAAAGAAPTAAQPQDQKTFEFSGWDGAPLRVWLLRTAQADADARVVFVMHGVGRDADRYLAEWAPLARAHSFVLVVPEFSQASFPKAAGYNLGAVSEGDTRARPRELWAYSAIEPIFDEVVRREGLHATRYSIYGHSAGAQFVHRFAMLGAGPRAERIVSANAGWYAFADASIDWPYGYGGVLESHFDLARALRVPLTILLGDADTDPNHRSLRRTPEALAQGAHRFERGRMFYGAAQRAATRSSLPFAWSCRIAPGVSHDNAAAARYAIPLLLGEAPASGGSCLRLSPENRATEVE